MSWGCARSVRRFALFAAFVLAVCTGAPSAVADDAAPGERETREALKALAESNQQTRAGLCARIVAHANARWAAVTAVELVSAAEDRLQKAVAERDKQGAKMFAFFQSKVARDFESRSKFTEFRMMEIDNRKLCGVVQEWTQALAQLQESGRTATARVAGDAEGAIVVADRVRRLVALSKRPSQGGAVLAALRGDAVHALAPDLHVWALPPSNRELSTAALRLLPLVPDAADAARLRPCADHPDPIVRRTAFRALAGIASTAAVDALVDRIAVEEGVPAGEIATHLYTLTEQTFGTNPRAWREWWDANRPTWKRDPERVTQAEKIEREPYSRYFGLELRSARILFVLDRSGSMSYGTSYRAGADEMAAIRQPTKMDVAVRELTNALQGLDERTSFNILAYGTSIEPFMRRPVRATRENREKAAKWIAKLQPDGQTNLAGSLLAAFENTRSGGGVPDEAVADTIVVLSDGEPNCGPIAYENDTLSELVRLNADDMVTVHAIFLGVDGDEAFMRSLAEAHGGKFVHHKE